MPDMEPITREEALMNGDYIEPITREEMILAGEDIEPITRREWFLKKYRGGGNVEVVTLHANENTTYVAPEGQAYSPVEVEVPVPTLTTLEVDENGTYTAPSGTAYNEVEVDVPLPENAYLLKDIPNTPTAIATFTDGANLPMPKLEVGIEPVQDLHGYDAPWVGGAGKNKYEGSPSFDGYEAKERWTLQTEKYNGHDVYKRDASWGGMYKLVDLEVGTYTFSCMCKTSDSAIVNIFLKVTDITTADTDVTNISVRTSTSWTRISGTFNVTTAGTVALRVERSDNNGDIYISEYQLESGSTATAFAPYSNECPISGWTACNVTRSGVNVWDEEWESGTYSNVDGSKVNDSSRIRSKNFIPIKPNTQYFVKLWQGATYSLRIFYYDKTHNFISSPEFIQEGTITTPSNAYYMTFICATTYGTTYNNDISINYPSTDTSYHAYNGHTYTIDLGGTRYGGTLDVVSGVLTVDRAMVDLGTLNWSYTSSSGRSLFTSNDITDYKHTGANDIPVNAISECFKIVSMSTIFKNGQMGMDGVEERSRIIICDNRYTDATSFKTAMSGVQLVYELATPLTIQLTPTVVKSLEGVNNVWGDCGDILDLSYFGKEE